MRGYALTQSNVQSASNILAPDAGDALDQTTDILESIIDPSGASEPSVEASPADVFKTGLGVNDGQNSEVQAVFKQIDSVGRQVIVDRSTSRNPFWDSVKSDATLVSSSRDVRRHRFDTLKSQVNVVNEKTAMNIDDFMDQGTPFSNEVEAAIFLEKVIADNQPDNESSLIYSNREPNMDKLSTTFKRFAQVQKQFPQLRTKSVKDFEKQMAQKLFLVIRRILITSLKMHLWALNSN